MDFQLETHDTILNSKRNEAEYLNEKYDETKLCYIFIVQEFVFGDIKQLLSSTPATLIEETHIITIMYNALCALNFIHSANIIHRDIKPGNLLTNEKCLVKICDFGLARTCP